MQALMQWWKNADSKTKWFYFQWALYGSVIVFSAIYIYVRLDFVRSYPTTPVEQTQKNLTN